MANPLSLLLHQPVNAGGIRTDNLCASRSGQHSNCISELESALLSSIGDASKEEAFKRFRQQFTYMTFWEQIQDWFTFGTSKAETLERMCRCHIGTYVEGRRYLASIDELERMSKESRELLHDLNPDTRDQLTLTVDELHQLPYMSFPNFGIRVPITKECFEGNRDRVGVSEVKFRPLVTWAQNLEKMENLSADVWELAGEIMMVDENFTVAASHFSKAATCSYGGQVAGNSESGRYAAYRNEMHKAAAICYEKGSLPEKAAKSYEAAGMHRKAADSFQEAELFVEAENQYSALLIYSQLSEIPDGIVEEVGGFYKAWAEKIDDNQEKLSKLESAAFHYEKFAALVTMGGKRVELYRNGGDCRRAAARLTSSVPEQATFLYSAGNNYHNASRSLQDIREGPGLIQEAVSAYEEAGTTYAKTEQFGSAGDAYELAAKLAGADKSMDLFTLAGVNYSMAATKSDWKNKSGLFEKAAECYANANKFLDASCLYTEAANNAQNPDRKSEMYRTAASLQEDLAKKTSDDGRRASLYANAHMSYRLAAECSTSTAAQVTLRRKAGDNCCLAVPSNAGEVDKAGALQAAGDLYKIASKLAQNNTEKIALCKAAGEKFSSAAAEVMKVDAARATDLWGMAIDSYAVAAKSAEQGERSDLFELIASLFVKTKQYNKAGNYYSASAGQVTDFPRKTDVLEKAAQSYYQAARENPNKAEKAKMYGAAWENYCGAAKFTSNRTIRSLMHKAAGNSCYQLAECCTSTDQKALMFEKASNHYKKASKFARENSDMSVLCRLAGDSCVRAANSGVGKERQHVLLETARKSFLSGAEFAVTCSELEVAGDLYVEAGQNKNAGDVYAQHAKRANDRGTKREMFQKAADLYFVIALKTTDVDTKSSMYKAAQRNYSYAAQFVEDTEECTALHRKASLCLKIADIGVEIAWMDTDTGEKRQKLEYAGFRYLEFSSCVKNSDYSLELKNQASILFRNAAEVAVAEVAVSGKVNTIRIGGETNAVSGKTNAVSGETNAVSGKTKSGYETAADDYFLSGSYVNDIVKKIEMFRIAGDCFNRAAADPGLNNKKRIELFQNAAISYERAISSSTDDREMGKMFGTIGSIWRRSAELETDRGKKADLYRKAGANYTSAERLSHSDERKVDLFERKGDCMAELFNLEEPKTKDAAVAWQAGVNSYRDALGLAKSVVVRNRLQNKYNSLACKREERLVSVRVDGDSAK
ncbi:hypothetical protein PQR05_36545 [Paraburkholderia sediminicola]|uniref:hypothetical protein n=1 Tax=Paraburkholderia sediminicola TaxID=458836 RepID=UPI0038BBB3EE